MNTIKIVWKIFRFPTFVFFLSLVALFPINFYDLYPWIDIPFHIIGGVSIAVGVSHFFSLLQEKKQLGTMRPWVQALLTVAMVAMVAVLWEDYEVLTDRFLGTRAQLGLFDTMKDLFDGLLGGVMGSLPAFLSSLRVPHHKRQNKKM